MGMTALIARGIGGRGQYSILSSSCKPHAINEVNSSKERETEN